MKNKIALSLTLLAAGLVVSACERAENPVVMRENLIGFWTLQPESYPSVRAHMKIDPKTASLDFRPDGTLIAVNMPYEIVDKYVVVSSTGQWEFPTGLPGQAHLTLGHGGYSLVFERDDVGAPRLYLALGDPDSLERWVWRKTVRR